MSFEHHPLELDYPSPLRPGFMTALRSVTLDKKEIPRYSIGKHPDRIKSVGAALSAG